MNTIHQKTNLGFVEPVGPPKCGTCPTSCFGEKMPLGRSFSSFSPTVQQKFEQLRQILVQLDMDYRSGHLPQAQQGKAAAQDKLIEIIPLVPSADFDLMAQTVERMVRMHSGSPVVMDFINAE